MSTPTRSVLMFGLVLLVGIGAYWVGRQRGKISVMLEKVEAGPASPDTDRLQEEIARLTMENARLQEQRAAQEAKLTAAQSETPANAQAKADVSVIERLRTLAELQKLPVVSQDGKLQPGFAQLFDLTPAEKDTLQQAFDYVRQQTEQAAAANATVSRRSDGAVVITVPPSPAGNALRDILMSTIAETLGPERNEAFLALNRSTELSSAMNGFGADERTVTISHAPGNGSPHIILQDYRKSSSSSTMRSFNLNAPTTDLSQLQLPENFRWVAPLIPANF